MDNPNEYDDDGYANYSGQLCTAIVALWEAGASFDNIQAEIENGFDNADVKVHVTITDA